ncbi:MAG: SAM-dependent methyltransferase [Pseudonocardiales bacterium]|nr:MAG: SAM-dependent methyltransferase [Pseudonocardiales bacterium]
MRWHTQGESANRHIRTALALRQGECQHGPVEISDVAALRSAAGRVLLDSIGRYDSAATMRIAETLAAAGNPAELVAAALTQARLRERARGRFGADADRMLFTPDGLEQATRATVAAHRAARLTGAGHRRVADLCCGIGGDTIALARAGCFVEAFELDPVTAAVAAANADELGLTGRARVTCADATAVDRTGFDAVFLDPSRRAGGRRIFDPGAYLPPWPFVAETLAGAACVKVAPGIPHGLVPAGVEAEWVSDHGEVKEAALWSGAFRTTSRRATLLPSGATLTDGAPGRPPVRAPGRWLYEPDGAVIRAHLVAEVAEAMGGALLDPRIAYLTTEAPVPTPFATAYEVTDVLPFALKPLRALLKAQDVGIVTVKKRGSPIEPETLRRQLRLSGSAHAVVIVTRVAGKPTVVLCRPPQPAA